MPELIIFDTLAKRAHSGEAHITAKSTFRRRHALWRRHKCTLASPYFDFFGVPATTAKRPSSRIERQPVSIDGD